MGEPVTVPLWLFVAMVIFSLWSLLDRLLIDRLVYDPQVVAAANNHARATNVPREVAMVEVRRYAREIVPTFNAYIYFRVGYSIARAIARFLYRVRLGFADERTLA